ncbi:MAG: helix-turn-helix domain-containing protein [Candidatus Woesearchaeota archaeon]|jgi:sugar-specific transcriptional regulator TrmB|nr:helix-turn-helix domain-containing protein [Candidatus Woesearchaeota archaeon]MDP7323166.1 helix-turn-helix domain-containing protein [Candidatus Woesearchaeota archaeon]MDP7457327.1 helix-turn-helix domain-containing protein [Candidatus Woesearchaeota archaeon]
MGDFDALKELGLTEAQSKAYLGLLTLGETTSGPLIQETGLQNSVVYNALNQLIELGLVSFILKGKRKFFSAANPQLLIRLAEVKRAKIEKIVPQLIAKQTLTKPKQEAQVFVGWKGLYNAFNYILEELPNGSEYIGFAAGFEDQYTEGAKRFFREFQKKRALMKYNVKLIVNEESRKQVEGYRYYGKFGKPHYRFVEGYAPVGVIIFKDHVLNVGFEDQPVAVLITSEAIASSYRRFFYGMWEIGKA